MENVRLKLSPPWITFVNELKALFGDDPQIKIVHHPEDYAVNLYVDDAAKATALAGLLPDHKTFGNIILAINVLPPNGEFCENVCSATEAELFEIAFEGNPALSFVRTLDTAFLTKWTYVVFANKVVQFFNDNLNDVYGNMTTLYENIARDIFEDPDVCFCTDVQTAVAAPAITWP